MNLRRHIDETLLVVDDGRPPSEVDRRRVGQLLEYTTRRRLNHVRGRLQSCDQSSETAGIFPGRAEKAVDDICARLMLVFNGDPRLPYPVHIRTPATQDLARDRIVDMALDAVVQAQLVPGTTSELPSQNRWGSMLVCLQRQVGGFMLHNLAGATATRTFSSWEDGDAPEESEDIRLVIKKKGYRVKCYAGSPSRQRRACVTLFTTTPLDHLWRHLQHIEVKGAALQDLGIPRLNSFSNAGRSFYQMVAMPVSEGPLAALFWHWGPPGHAAHSDLLEEVRGLILHRAAHMWYRLDLPLRDFPYKLCRMIDARLQRHEQLEVAKEFFSTPLCCLDPGFSRKVRELYNSPQEMFDCPAFRTALTEWGLASYVTNMPLERLLALIKAASPERAPLLERVCSAGLMCQLLAAHKAGGGADPGVHKAADLAREGAPLRVAETRAASKARVRPSLLYANKELQVAKKLRARQGLAADGAESATLSRVEVRRLLSTAARRFAQLPPDQKLPFIAEARRRSERAAEQQEAADTCSAGARAASFFGQGSNEFPISAEATKTALLTRLGLPPCGFDELPGFTSYSDQLREEARAKMFVLDRGRLA